VLARLARFCYRRRWIVLGVWVVLLVALSAMSGAIGTDFHTDFKQPDSESKRVQDALTSGGSAAQAGFPGTIVFTSPNNDDPAVQQAMTGLFDKVKALEGVSLTSPYDPAGEGFRSKAGTGSNTLGKDVYFAQLSITERDQAATQKFGKAAQKFDDDIQVTGLKISYGGQIFAKFQFPDSEILGVLAAVVILLVAFGSVIAMGLPIGTALLGIGISFAVVGLASHVFSIPEFGTSMTAMIGLGVGIDYALFIVTRYREHLHAGEDPERSTVAAVDTSGRAVIFAGLTVIISLLGLFIIRLPFVSGLAVAGATAVLVMMLAAITLLPALLGFTKARIDVTSRAAAIGVGLLVLLGLIGFIGGQPGPFIGIGVAVALILTGLSYVPFLRSLRQPLPVRRDKPREQRFWFKWSRGIQHRPWPAFAGGALILIVLALPVFSIRLGFGDDGNAAKGTTVRTSYDLIASAFGPGSNGPLFLTTTDPNANAQTVVAVTDALQADPDVAFVQPPFQVGATTWAWQAYPKDAPQNKATTDLVERLRNDVLPTTGLNVDVGGFTAGGIDFSHYLAGRLLYLIGAVLILSFILLMAVFRSLLVPLKAVIMNLLSVGAAYGIVVAIFQWGWGRGLIGVDKAGPIDPWVPMMLFAIVFGLSMDYEVFLLSRMKEEFDRTGDNATAVADGLALTARVITAAAIIMFCVFAAFVGAEDRGLKLFGLGLAVAVLVDATVVRMVLVPATMELLGARNWWLPKWLDRILPKIDVEGHESDPTLDDRERESELV
jgi:putative drug exporter of the RND superfamily